MPTACQRANAKRLDAGTRKARHRSAPMWTGDRMYMWTRAGVASWSACYRDRRDRMWRAVLAFAGDPEVASDAVEGSLVLTIDPSWTRPVWSRGRTAITHEITLV